MAGAFFILIKKYRHSVGIEKQQIRYFFIGAFLTVLSASITNIFAPLFTGYWATSHFGPYFSIVLIGFTTYAITQHQLFNIRVIGTELLTFIIWIFLLVKTVLSKTYQDFLINLGLLVSVIIVGALLIRSVLKEVRQREKMEEMAKEVKEAYEVEKRARKELQRLDKAKDQFLMATQHHLRTPLTSMQGYLDLIFGGTYGKVPAKLGEILQKFWKSTREEIKIVNELLDVSQFQLGKEVITLKPNINIIEILKEIVEELRVQAEGKGIYLKLERPKEPIPLIKADSSKLKVALVNVIDNGVKYTKQGGVTIKIKNQISKIKIIVQDTGLGIPKEELPTLFTKTFERGEEAKRVWGPGKGIGLYLTSQIIQAHKGRIWAGSEGKGKGSTFYVELPVG